MTRLNTSLTKQLGIEIPVIGGAMYPCSNPELVAAISEAGGIGVIQPLSLTYVWGYDFEKGLKYIRTLTSKPLGFNALIEKNSKVYEERMNRWIEIALREGIRFFVTSLGNPVDVVKKVHASGGLVYHDCTERKWAQKALDAGVDGLICVNNRAGGHAGSRDPKSLFAELADLGCPLVCAGGVGDEKTFAEMLDIGYVGVQMGTRFIATEECRSPVGYKDAIVAASEDEIVLTERVTGVPLAVINTPYVQEIGTKAGLLARFLLKHPRTKYWMRTLYNVGSMWKMRRSMHKGLSTKDYWQAGKSVSGIKKIEPVKTILTRFRKIGDGA